MLRARLAQQPHRPLAAGASVKTCGSGVVTVLPARPGGPHSDLDVVVAVPGYLLRTESLVEGLSALVDGEHVKDLQCPGQRRRGRCVPLRQAHRERVEQDGTRRLGTGRRSARSRWPPTRRRCPALSRWPAQIAAERASRCGSRASQAGVERLEAPGRAVEQRRALQLRRFRLRPHPHGGMGPFRPPVEKRTRPLTNGRRHCALG